jgi:uncharacterized repeat protein (TIGR02059 family)
MPVTKINLFGGMIPAINNRLLPDTNAAISRDTWLYSGPLSGFKEPVYIRDLEDSNTKRVFRIPLDPYEKTNFNNSTWMEFTDPTVDVVRGPINDDAYSRYYWTGESTICLYNSLQRIQNGDPPLKLGVPEPAVAPGIVAPVTPDDTVAPVAASMTVDGSIIVITFTEERLLDSLAIPPRSAFVVTAVGVQYQVANVYISARGLTVTLELIDPVPANSEVSVSYTQPGSEVAIKDSSGNLAANFTLTLGAADNETVDVAGPVFGWADATASTIWVTFIDDSEIDFTSVPAPTAFTISVSGSATLSVVSVTAFEPPSLKAFELVLSGPLYPEQTVKLNYVKPGTGFIRDEYGNAAPGFAGAVVRNNTTAQDVPTGPIPVSAETINTNQIRVVFSKEINDKITFSLSEAQARFTVTIDGVAATVTSNSSLSQVLRAATIGVAEVIPYGAVLKVSYSAPSGTPTTGVIQDLNGHNSLSFTNYTVTNNVTYVDTYTPPE